MPADVARQVAAEHCLLHFPTMYTAGRPCPPVHSKPALWRVPIVVVDVEQGPIGEVGELFVDVLERKVIRETPRDAVTAAGKKLLPR